MQIQNRRSGDRVDERDVAAFQSIFGPVKIHFAFDDVSASNYDRLAGSSTEMQISIPGKPDTGGLHLQLGRGNDMNIQPDPIE